MNPPRTIALARGVVVEDMGECCLVMVPGRSDVLTVSGPAVEVLHAVLDGAPVSWSSRSYVDELLHAGVLAGQVSRRSIVSGGVTAIGAGVGALVLPSASYASSVQNCRIVEPVGSSVIYFGPYIRNRNTNNPPTPDGLSIGIFREGLPSGTYYYRLSGPASGTINSFSETGSFEVTTTGGEYADFPAYFANGTTPESNGDYTVKLVAELFTDPTLGCPVVTSLYT